MRLKNMGWVVLVIALMLCSACTQPGASVAMSDAAVLSNSNNSAGTDAPLLYCEKTQLFWEVPQCEYRTMDTVSGENGFAVLYIEHRTRNGDLDREPNYYIMAQLFDAQGNHVQTAYTGVWSDSAEDLALHSVQLANGRLYYTREGNYHYSMDAATGYVDEWCYEKLLEENKISLSYSTNFQETPYTMGMRFCLTDAEGKTHEILIPEYDDNFGMAISFLITGEEHEDRQGPTYEAAVELNSAAKTAVISNTKLTYTLDFNDLSYTCTRRYTDEMIEELLATSPDGKHALYYADGGGAGDAFWRDIVLRRQDGNITLLTACSLLYGADFFNNDVVVLNEVDSLTAYDITGEQAVGQLLLDLGSVTEADADKHIERLIVGMAVDHKNKLLLAATRNYTEDWDILMPVSLVVFDASLKQIDELKTDCQIRPFRNNWTMPCNIAINGDGTADLSWHEESSVQVRYLV